MFAADVIIGNDEKLTSRYVGRVFRGSQQEKVSLETAHSIEGILSVSVGTITYFLSTSCVTYVHLEV